MTHRIHTIALAALFLPVLAAAPVAAQQFVLPWEEAEQAKPQVDPDHVETIRVMQGKLEVRRLPVAGSTIISSHPEIADIAVEAGNLLFVMGRSPGRTIVVIADAENSPVYTASIQVTVPEDPDAKYR